MERFEWGDHIVFDPQILVGKATIKGTRISAELIMEMIAAGRTEGEILEAYPFLSPEGIQACLGYAVHLVRKETAKIVRQNLKTIREKREIEHNVSV